jgi:hypothetical protein
LLGRQFADHGRGRGGGEWGAGGCDCHVRERGRASGGWFGCWRGCRWCGDWFGSRSVEGSGEREGEEKGFWELHGVAEEITQAARCPPFPPVNRNCPFLSIHGA